MIDVTETSTGLRAVDAAKNEVVLEIDGWSPGGNALNIERDVDVTLTGTADEIQLPKQGVMIDSDKQEQLRWVPFGEQVTVPMDEHLVHAEAAIIVFVRMNGPFVLVSDPLEDWVTLIFSQNTPVTLGFRSRVSAPAERVGVPPTNRGLAYALSVCADAHKTNTPDRSYPSMRDHPPLLYVDDEVAIAEAIEDHPESSTVVRMPRCMESLFVVAPLVYYLGATVEVESRETPRLETDSIEYDFSGAEAFPEEVEALLSRVFYLDCLVRNAGQHSADIQELDLLDEFSLDLERLYSLSTGERFGEYLDVPFEQIADAFPEWPLAVSIEPTVDNVSTIPHLLDRLSLILPPSPKAVDERTIFDRSLDDFHRATTGGNPTGRRAIYDVIEPEVRRGVVHGWIADGTPVEAFKCPPEAFSNRLDYLTKVESEPLSFAVVVNDSDMDTESAEVAATYRSRAEAFSIEVDVMNRLTTDELARTFESEYDFVHYIGHCDPEGLRCHDGNLSTSTLSESNVQSFFLNACRSYDEGLALISRGSVAGAVTIGDVLDDQAGKVGTTFARMLGHGYSIEQSLRLARARTIMNRQYGIVGDGTHVLTQGSTSTPAILSVSKTDADEYRLCADSSSPSFHGSLFQLDTAPRPVIVGNDTTHLVSEERFKRHLQSEFEPILFDGKLYWSDELLDVLA